MGAEASDSVVGVSERGEGVEVINPTPEATTRFRPQGHAVRGRSRKFAWSHIAGCVRCQSFSDAFCPSFLERSVQRCHQGGSSSCPQKARTAVLCITWRWKLFMSLPRLLLFRVRRGGKFPRRRWRNVSTCSKREDGIVGDEQEQERTGS